MKIKLLSLFFFFSINIIAQTPADVDLVIGSNFIGFTNVTALAEQPDGKIVVGGQKPSGVQGIPGDVVVARFNANGTVDATFQVNTFSHVGNSARFLNDIVVLPEGKILVGGYFLTMNGESVPGLISLNADGSKDTTFLYSGGAVNSIAMQADGKIVIVGSFNVYVNEHLQRDAARLNADGTLDHTFDFGFAGFSSIGVTLNKVVVQADGKIVIGGGFSVFNNIPQGKLIRFNADGSKDITFDIGLGATGNILISDIKLQPDGKILLSGGFTTWNGQPFAHICRLNLDGSLDTSFVFPSGNSFARNLDLQSDGKIIAIGGFNVNGIQKSMLRLNTNGSIDATLVANPNNIPECLKIQADGKILIGGLISNIAGVSKNCLARLNTNGMLDNSFELNTGLNEKVFSIALQTDGKTLFSGEFTTFDGGSQNRLIRVDEAGNKDVSFSIGTGFNGSVRKVVVQTDGKIIAGGDFSTFNGETANGLVRLNSDGSKDPSFVIANGFNDYVKAIAVQPDGKILIGGNFTQFSGESQNYLIRLNADGSKDGTFNIASGFNNRITCIVLQPDGKIIVGGNFTTFNNLDQKGLIRFNNDGTKDLSFDVGTGFTIFNSADLIRDIEVATDGKIYIASLSSSYNGSSVGRPFRLNSNGTVDESFTQGAVVTSYFSVDALGLQQDGKLIVGGSFISINNSTLHPKRIMRLNTDGTLDTTFDRTPGQTENFSDGFNEGSCTEIVMQPDNKIWVGGSFFNYRGVSSFSVIRLVGDEFLSTEDIDAASNNILVYPNPVKDVLYFKNTFKTIAITDLSGKLLAKLENTNQVNFSNYPEGLYFVTVALENGASQTKKIVKQ